MGSVRILPEIMLIAAVVALTLAVIYLGSRLRALERRFEDLGDRSIDWRIRLARNQEDLAGELRDVRRHVGMKEPQAAAQGSASPDPEGLLQIRKRPDAGDTTRSPSSGQGAAGTGGGSA